MSPYPYDPARAVGPLRLVISTYPSKDAALAAADEVVKRRLAACANVVPASSRYWWKGKVESAEEAVVLFKTVPKRVGALFRFLHATHPYEVPEVIEVDVPRSGAPYLEYLAATLDPESPPPPLGGGSTHRGARRGRGARSPARTRARHRRRSR